jgi:HD-like signal output (HDOD) protein
MKPTLLARIKSLPPLPKTIVEIDAVIKNPEGTINDITEIVKQDPMIVANILKAANSPLYGFGQEIKMIDQAVALFGMNMTRAIVLGTSIRKLLNVDMEPYGISPEDFAKVSEQQATLVTKWQFDADKETKELYHLAALLQETGKILLADEVIQSEQVNGFQEEISQTPNLAEVERKYAEVASSIVTAEIFEHWKLDKSMIEMIRYSDNITDAPTEYKKGAAVLNIVKTAIPLNTPLSDRNVNLALQKAKRVNMNPDTLKEAIDMLKGNA